MPALALGATGCGEDSVDGAGYTYAIPDGWTEAPQDVIGELFPMADSVVFVEGEPEEFANNVLVLATGPQPPGVDLTQQAQAGISALQENPVAAGFPPGTGITVVSPPAPTTLADLPAVQFEVQMNVGEGAYIQRQVSASGPDGNGFTIAGTAASAGTAEALQGFDDVVASWQWE